MTAKLLFPLTETEHNLRQQKLQTIYFTYIFAGLQCLFVIILQGLGCAIRYIDNEPDTIMPDEQQMTIRLTDANILRHMISFKNNNILATIYKFAVTGSFVQFRPCLSIPDNRSPLCNGSNCLL